MAPLLKRPRVTRPKAAFADHDGMRKSLSTVPWRTEKPPRLHPRRFLADILPYSASMELAHHLILIGAGTRRADSGLQPPPDGDARIRKTAALYRTCRQHATRCTVVMSGGDPQHHGDTEAAVYGRQLIAQGVDSHDLVLEPKSRTTYENAKFTASILRSQHDDSLILVTSSYQMRRALLDFRRFGLDPQPVYSNRRRAQTGWLPRRHNLVDAEQALHELVGIAQFHVYRMLGWF